MVVEVVGWFVSPIIRKLIDTALEYAGEKYIEQRDLKVNMGKLADDLKYISQTVEQVRTRRINSQSNRDGDDPLWWLRDALDEAEDVLDLFKYEILKVYLEKKRRSSGPTKAMDSSAEVASVGPIVIKKPLGSRLQKVVGNLGNVRERVLQDLQLHTSSSTVPPPIASRKEAGLYPDKEHFFGYDKEYARLISMLKNGKDKLVIAILGHGLMGKTELARQAFHDVTRDYIFDLPIWVPACNKFTGIDLLKEIWKSVVDNIHVRNKFTGTDLLKEIWKSVVGNIPVDEMNVPILQQKLEKLLEEKRYLLVLDDVWHDESANTDKQRYEPWKTALAPFERFGKEGSRILMTTRAKICSTTLNAHETIVLNGINIDTDKTSQQLEQLPNENDRLSENEFTYKHLPPHLQRCFAFCSIFPTNWRFEPEKLTKMWIAHGFVEDTHEKSMEDVARGYFDDLVDRSLFEEKEDKETVCYYVIHEDIHYMIRKVSANYCMSIAGADSTSIPTTVRHLSVTRGCLGQLLKFGELNKLRTLLVLKDDDPSSMPSPLSAIDNVLLKKFKGVRVLDVTETGVTQLPESIGDLTHLRYLGLPHKTKFPNEVTRLLFLQTFCVSKRCHEEDRECLPDDMNMLINMRHLDIDIECIAKISGIGRLDKLQGSIEFQANKKGQFQANKKGHKMSELASMNSLRRTLSIKGLETVQSKKEAKEAQLKTKKFVKALKLEWGPPAARQDRPNAGSSAATPMSILEDLQPHPNLRELSIKRYGGTTSPSWLADSSALANLICLYLWNCRELQALPAMGELPCLELLDIKELPSVKRINGNFCGNGGTFPKLKKIVLNDMPKLISWDDMPQQAFPQLREVSIIDCPSLSSLSGLGCCSGPPKLRLERCPAIKLLPANFTSGDFTCI